VVSTPHGGRLVRRIASSKKIKDLVKESKTLKRIRLDYETTVDAESIAHGIYSPLEGFMNEEEYLSVLDSMRLQNDIPWTIPIVLGVSKEEIKNVRTGDEIILEDSNNTSIALMQVEDIYKFDKKEYAEKVFKTIDPKHPGVNSVLQLKEMLIGGKIEMLSGIENRFERYTLTPVETRVLFEEKSWKSIVGFQTRNAPHIGHEYIQKSALAFVDGVFVNPVIGRKKPGDFTDEAIVESYRVLLHHYYPKNSAVMGILRYEMKYAGPREAILHAIIRKNFGCTHFAVGRDHAGVGSYYGPYEAQEIFKEFPDLGVTPVFFREFYHCKKCNAIVNEKICPHSGDDVTGFSGTKIRDMIVKGLRPPVEIMRTEVADEILKFKSPFVE